MGVEFGALLTETDGAGLPTRDELCALWTALGLGGSARGAGRGLAGAYLARIAQGTPGLTRNGHPGRRHVQPRLDRGLTRPQPDQTGRARLGTQSGPAMLDLEHDEAGKTKPTAGCAGCEPYAVQVAVPRSR